MIVIGKKYEVIICVNRTIKQAKTKLVITICFEFGEYFLVVKKIKMVASPLKVRKIRGGLVAVRLNILLRIPFLTISYHFRLIAKSKCEFEDFQISTGEAVKKNKNRLKVKFFSPTFLNLKIQSNKNMAKTKLTEIT